MLRVGWTMRDVIGVDAVEAGRTQSKIRWVAWMFFAEAGAVIAINGFALFTSVEPYRWALLASGTVAVPILAISGIMVKKGQFEILSNTTLLQSISVVNLAFFGWYAGEAIASSHGNLAGVEFTLERLAFGAIFMSAAIVAYRGLYNLTLEHMENEEPPAG